MVLIVVSGFILLAIVIVLTSIWLTFLLLREYPPEVKVTPKENHSLPNMQPPVITAQSTIYATSLPRTTLMADGKLFEVRHGPDSKGRGSE